MATKKIIVGLGELLWDMLPSGERLGGAPANFSVMASRLGNRGVIEPGRRADLLLVDGDPVRDIKATQAIRRIWCGGEQVTPG